MRKIFYSAVITSLLVAGVAHAEDGMSISGKVMMGAGGPTSTMMRIDPTWMRGGDDHMSSGTPPMVGKPDFMMFSSTSMPMMGSGTPPMCRKFARALAFGAKGDDVKELQEMLHENGYLSASSTGYFGKMTKEAVIKFQKEGGLNPSGYFGELSRKQHEKRCGEGKGHGDDKRMGSTTPPMGEDWKRNGSSTMPVPCMTNATTTGCDHSNAFPWKMGTSSKPCMTMFDPSTGRPCKLENDDRKPPMMGTGTPPTGIMCTMEARMCPDGTMMPRDNSCGWHPEKCAVVASTTVSGTVTQ